MKFVELLETVIAMLGTKSKASLRHAVTRVVWQRQSCTMCCCVTTHRRKAADLHTCSMVKPRCQLRFAEVLLSAITNIKYGFQFSLR